MGRQILAEVLMVTGREPKGDMKLSTPNDAALEELIDLAEMKIGALRPEAASRWQLQVAAPN